MPSIVLYKARTESQVEIPVDSEEAIAWLDEHPNDNNQDNNQDTEIEQGGENNGD